MLQMSNTKNIKWWAGLISMSFLFLVIVIFAYIKTNSLINGTRLEARVIEINKALLEIRGQSKNTAYLSVNGREVRVDKEGKFREVISLLPGFSTIQVSSEDKFGNLVSKKFDVYYKEGSRAVAILSKTEN
jgi:hypothetical protein